MTDIKRTKQPVPAAGSAAPNPFPVGSEVQHKNFTPSPFTVVYCSGRQYVLQRTGSPNIVLADVTDLKKFVPPELEELRLTVRQAAIMFEGLCLPQEAANRLADLLWERNVRVCLVPGEEPEEDDEADF